MSIILVIMTALISYRAFNDSVVRGKLIFYPKIIKEQGEWYRFLTSGFIHADYNHLLINMFVLWQFGEVAEELFPIIFGPTYGKIVFILFYLSAIIISSIPSYFRHQDNPSYAALGASGATSALVFVYIFLAPWNWFLFPPLPAILLGIGYLMYSSYMDKRGTDNIGHNAHFWGAVYGIVFIVSASLSFRPELFESFISQLLAGPF